MVVLRKGLLLLAAENLLTLENPNVRCALQRSKVLPALIGGKELMLATDKSGSRMTAVSTSAQGSRSQAHENESHRAFHHSVCCCPRNMQGSLLAGTRGTTSMSRQGKLKLTHGAWKERRPAGQKPEMPTEADPMEEPEENFNENIMELQHEK